MKTSNLILLLFLLFVGSCKENESFNPELRLTILEAKDSLKDELTDNKLLSIEFYSPDRYERRCMMKIFASKYYSSSHIDAFTRIGNTTIAIYNIKDDIYETINKNNITFFKDTIPGYMDTLILSSTKKKFFYSIYKPDSITKTNYILGDFPASRPLRKPRCGIGETFMFPKKYWFYLDSLQAEREVEYYRKQ